MPIEVRGLGQALSKLELVKRRLRARIIGLVSSHTRLMKVHARRNAPVGEGTLKQSITSLTRGMYGAVYTPLEYAPSVEKGADPHEIRPNQADALHFFWEKVGREVFFGQVDHPGQEAQGFFEDAANEIYPRMKRAVKREVRKTIGL